MKKAGANGDESESQQLEAMDEEGWHPPGCYANLTLDDPCLREPFGYLIYGELMKEMERVNFHTTIAFTPWYYDRNTPNIVSLFRDRTDRLSVCVHGNNHDGREFYKYETDPGDSWPAKSLVVQEENIVQALARMEEFKKLTGVDYDKVMVFPHAIAPAKTLGLLKKYGFLSTVNDGNVPLGTEPPVEQVSNPHFEPPFFENFVSLDRWLAGEVSRDNVVDAVSQGRPLLFYEHHGFFETGNDAFSPIAEMVNAIEPRVQWKSLGYISRHLYQLRRRSDGNYDVRAFCKKLELENAQEHSVVYHVEKMENFVPSVKRVTLDGESIDFEKTDDILSFSVEVPAGASRVVDIEYETEKVHSSVDISRKGVRLTALRQMSAIRDLYLANSAMGRGITRLYHKSGAYKSGPIRLSIMGLLGVASVLPMIASFISRRIRSK